MANPLTVEMDQEEEALFASLHAEWERQQADTPKVQRSTDERSQLAAKLFPREWARVATMSGKSASKKRNQLRHAAENKVKVDALRAAGARCSNCGSFETEPPHVGWKHGLWCSFHSDFHGYAIPDPDGLCMSHSKRT